MSRERDEDRPRGRAALSPERGKVGDLRGARRRRRAHRGAGRRDASPPRAGSRPLRGAVRGGASPAGEGPGSSAARAGGMSTRAPVMGEGFGPPLDQTGGDAPETLPDAPETLPATGGGRDEVAVLAVLAAGPASGRELAARLHRRWSEVSRALRALEVGGRIVRSQRTGRGCRWSVARSGRE